MRQVVSEYDREIYSVWIRMRPEGVPSFTPNLLHDLRKEADTLNSRCDYDFAILSSDVPGVFSYGGDLALFAQLAERRDKWALTQYAELCIQNMWSNMICFGRQSAITVALVQGDALGGGFEAALGCSFLAAEKDARFAFPEVISNVFPGMGACNLLPLRCGTKVAQDIITSGDVYTSQQLHELGVVDLVLPKGEGVEALRHYLHNLPSRNSFIHYRRGRQIAEGVSLRSLQDIGRVWVQCVLNADEESIRRMRRISRAQAMKFNSPS